MKEILEMFLKAGVGNSTDFALQIEATKLARKALEAKAAPVGELGGWKLVPVEPTPEMVDSALLSSTAIDPRSIVIEDYKCMLAAAPFAPKADDPVKQMLLEALENTAAWIEQLPVPTAGAAGQLVKIDKAIAAAQEGGKV